MKLVDAIEKAAAALARIQPDKLLHFIGGQIVWHIFWRLTHNAPAAAIVTIAVGVLKEQAYDRWMNKRAIARGESPPHTVDGNDAVATTLGGMAQWLTHL